MLMSYQSYCTRSVVVNCALCQRIMILSVFTDDGRALPKLGQRARQKWLRQLEQKSLGSAAPCSTTTLRVGRLISYRRIFSFGKEATESGETTRGPVFDSHRLIFGPSQRAGREGIRPDGWGNRSRHAWNGKGNLISFISASGTGCTHCTVQRPRQHDRPSVQSTRNLLTRCRRRIPD